jgi:hypothetical protein
MNGIGFKEIGHIANTTDVVNDNQIFQWQIEGSDGLLDAGVNHKITAAGTPGGDYFGSKVGSHLFYRLKFFNKFFGEKGPAIKFKNGFGGVKIDLGF